MWSNWWGDRRLFAFVTGRRTKLIQTYKHSGIFFSLSISPLQTWRDEMLTRNILQAPELAKGMAKTGLGGGTERRKLSDLEETIAALLWQEIHECVKPAAIYLTLNINEETWMQLWLSSSSSSTSWKWKRRQFSYIFVIACFESCQFDNFRWASDENVVNTMTFMFQWIDN